MAEEDGMTRRLALLLLLLAVVACQPDCRATVAAYQTQEPRWTAIIATQAPLETAYNELAATAVALATQCALPDAPDVWCPEPFATPGWALWYCCRTCAWWQERAGIPQWYIHQTIDDCWMCGPAPQPTLTVTPTLPPMLCLPCTNDAMCGPGLFCKRDCAGGRAPLCVRASQPSTDCRECP